MQTDGGSKGIMQDMVYLQRTSVNCDREGNGKSFAKLPPPTEEALIEVQYFRELAHEESTKRRKTEQDLFSALQMIGEWKMLHQHEIWGRQAIEEQYLRDRQEVREMIRKFEAIYDQLDDVQELKWRITEMETARKNHKEALITSNNFIKILQADNENLQQELMQRITEMESAREGHKEELAVSKSRIKMLQADKKKLQRELKQCITEMESARKDHKEELVTSNYLVKKLQADNKKLHYDLNRCITDIQSARKDYEEELTTSKYLVELLQSDKETLQKDLQAALTEAVDLRRKSLLSSASEADSTSPPSYFVCPISQEVMSDPHVAADGFTYGGEEIRGWLDSGHDTSPMTNLKLSHSVLTPNRALRSAILEWQQQQQHST
ncbi:putative U-box domain-containing protein 55 [Setaria italica]|uniref:putative U-box domain-containing protein 55 n=1 Tax=Setaria italica TaxID=4555 RepID=UPI000BE4FBE9|nr:putative U-box domain-containing protein 55 [Setaria italica]